MTWAAIAFSAGLVSFATPCVLPLVPAYLSAIGVRTGDARSALRAGLPFVLGFSAVFVAMGVGVAVVGGRFADYRTDLIHLGGILIVAMGFVMMGLLRVPALERSMQPALEPAAATGSSAPSGRRLRPLLDALRGAGAGGASGARLVQSDGRIGCGAPGRLLGGAGGAVPGRRGGLRQGDGRARGRCATTTPPSAWSPDASWWRSGWPCSSTACASLNALVNRVAQSV